MRERTKSERQNLISMMSGDSLGRMVTRRSLLKRAAVLGAAVPVVAGLLAACGDDDDSDDDTEDPVAPDEEDEPEDEGDDPEEEDEGDEPSEDEDEPVEDDEAEDEPTDEPTGERGILRYGRLHDPAGMDPHIDYGASSSTFQGNQYDNLIGWDQEGNFDPELAESWETPDPTTFIFHLREGVTFHDGSPFSAEDVIFTFERILDEATGATNRPELERIDTFEAEDEFTVRVVTGEPYVTLLTVLAGSATYIISKNFTEANDPHYDSETNGTGPFYLGEFEPGVQYNLERFDDYWHDDYPLVDRLEYIPIDDDTARVNALLTGDVNFADYIPWQHMQEIDDSPDLVLHEGFDLFNCVRINVSEPPLDDPRVRQALNFAIDRQAVIDIAFGGRGEPQTVALIRPGDPFYNDDLDGHWTYDPDRALSLLSDAGLQPSDITLEFVSSTLTVHQDTAEVVEQFIADLGINISIVSIDQAELAETRTGGTYQLMQDGLSLRPDPDLLYSDFFATGGERYAAAVGYSNERIDELLAEGRAVVDEEERKGIYRQVEEQLLEDAPFIFILWRPQAEAHHSSVSGYVRNPVLGLYSPRYLKYASVDEG